MAKYRLSRRADNDLVEIAEYTIREFGIEQARHYRDALEVCFSALADNPLMGRTICSTIEAFRAESHSVFYMSDDVGVLVMRILHERLDVTNHLFR